MSLGRIIRERRKKLNLSQEQLAKQLSVSRSAIAKWENDLGIPDIENIKNISKLLQISFDDLLNNDVKTKLYQSRNEKIKKYLFKKCSVELIDWNDGVYAVILLNQDDAFVYYFKEEKKDIVFGLLGKKYIKQIESSKKNDEVIQFKYIDKNFFIGKSVSIYLHEAHFFSGLIGADTEFIDAKIIDVSGGKIIFESKDQIEDRVLAIENIAKIEYREKS